MPVEGVDRPVGEETRGFSQHDKSVLPLVQEHLPKSLDDLVLVHSFSSCSDHMTLQRSRSEQTSFCARFPVGAGIRGEENQCPLSSAQYPDMLSTDAKLAELARKIDDLAALIRKLADAQPSDPEWLSVEDSAKALGMHPESVRKLIRTGQLPAANISSDKRPTYRVSREDLDLFAQSKRVHWTPSESERDALANKWLGKKLAS